MICSDPDCGCHALLDLDAVQIEVAEEQQFFAEEGIGDTDRTGFCAVLDCFDPGVRFSFDGELICSYHQDILALNGRHHAEYGSCSS